MEIKDLIKEVLEKGYLMSLATLDNGGAWVSDVIYIHDDNLDIYWMSHAQTRHSKAILENPKIAATITVNGPGEDNLGIQFEGVAQKIDGEREDLVEKHYNKRKKPKPIGSNGLHGASWYIIKPTKIELIHEKHFGFDKQKLDLSDD